MLHEFCELHGDAKNAIGVWGSAVTYANWENPNEVRLAYRTASFIGNGVVVFDIKGNTYRLVARIEYRKKIVKVLFVGSHSEYDKVDVGNF